VPRQAEILSGLAIEAGILLENPVCFLTTAEITTLSSGTVVAFPSHRDLSVRAQFPPSLVCGAEGFISRVFAALFWGGVMNGLWFPPADGRGWLVLFAAAAIAVTALHEFVWMYRARSAKRWKAALDAYAAQEIARDRGREAPPTTGKVDRRNSHSFNTLIDRLAGELTDLAYHLVLRQGVKGFSVDVELAIWKAIDDTLREMLQPLLAGTAQTPPAVAIVLVRLTKAVYQAALRCGFIGTFADMECGLWDAFHTGSFPGRVKELLRTLFRRAREAVTVRPARSPTQDYVAEQQVALHSFNRNDG
jgi:hypothetical protein